MKKILVLLFSCIAIYTSANAQADSAKPATAKIYFIRQTGFTGSLVNFRAKMDDSVICRMANKRYSIHDIAPGTHTFYVTSWDNPQNKKNGLELEIESGKTYYLRMVLKQGLFENTLYYQEITQNSAAPLIEKCKQETDCSN